VGCSCAPLLWVFLAATVLPVRANAQAEPAWVSPTTLVTADGYATLKWSIAGDDPVALFRLTEEHAGTRQISYTDQAQMRVLRDEPGIYTFSIQACTRSADGYPQCGQVSRTLVLTVVGKTGDQKGKTSTSSALQAIEVAPVTAAVFALAAQ
jgi:hypothetical protein